MWFLVCHRLGRLMWGIRRRWIGWGNLREVLGSCRGVRWGTLDRGSLRNGNRRRRGDLREPTRFTWLIVGGGRHRRGNRLGWLRHTLGRTPFEGIDKGRRLAPGKGGLR